MLHLRFDNRDNLRRDDEGGASDQSSDPVEQFDDEIQYSSDCISEDRKSKANGREGLPDMRVLAAIGRPLETGAVVVLEAATRDRRISLDQALRLTPVTQPREGEMPSMVSQATQSWNASETMRAERQSWLAKSWGCHKQAYHPRRIGKEAGDILPAQHRNRPAYQTGETGDEWPEQGFELPSAYDILELAGPTSTASSSLNMLTASRLSNRFPIDRGRASR